MERKTESRVSRVGVALLSAPLLLTLLTPLTLPARGQPPDSERSRVERLARRARERMRTLRQEADELVAKERSLLEELRRLEVERQLKAEELTPLNAELEETTRQLAETADQVERLERTVVIQRPDVEARLVELYKLGRPGYSRMLLGVGDLRQLGRAYRAVSALAELDRQQVAEHRQALEALKSSQSTLRDRQGQVAALQEETRRTRRGLDRAITAQSDLVQSIDERRDLTAQLTGELHLAQQQLQAAMAAGRQSHPAQVTLPLRPFRGELERPVAGDVAMPFGRHQQTRSGTTIVRNGIEISAAEGSPVKAVHEGQVAFADTFTGFGNLVILDHGGQSYSSYGYLSFLAVQRGTHVDRHEVLGTVGRAPAGQAGLYFELRIDGNPVDPVEWLKE